MINKILFFEDLGKKEYQETWQYQKTLFNQLLKQKKLKKKLYDYNSVGYLLFVEHPHVYTIGKNGNHKNLLVSYDFLNKIGIPIYETDRGGDITYHGPGQLVIYPILDMDYFFPDIHKYLRCLEIMIIHFLKYYGIKGQILQGKTGVWLLNENSGKIKKICSIGIRMSRWVTMHGIAININTNLRYFDHIIPCGIKNKKMTSLKEELKQEHMSFSEAKNIVKQSFKKIFQVILYHQ
ncbi:lipoyl(octanoyl) transferase LipB [Blattabacterium cuenoti]|uniref:lipoyl(octanoyl) transferase LipB n=1 Tax=Blattabacterium cuenoti TaxID=1653831 RepID=UPI00163B732E|nr:lipoyl(octanoyl) transferase LipB [Blattabacterium cuenoti]